MPIPDFQSIMLPMLKVVATRDEWKMNELTEQLASELNLTENELKERLPSGMTRVFYNRAAWARIYLTNLDF